MSKMEVNAEVLGLKVKDAVTGFEGVATSICFDLYGCIQVIVTPSATDDGKIEDGRWFDISRLTTFDEPRVMGLPNFIEGSVAEGLKGGCEKPLP